MALSDINFQEGEIQDFVLELPPVVYVGVIEDINIEPGSTQYLLMEIPSTGGNIFIMSE